MAYYLKKHWKLNILVFFIQLVWAATMVIPNVLLIQLAQEIVNRNINGFIFWLVIDFAIYSLCGGLECMRGWAKSKAIQAMNNDVRADISASILKGAHRDFHAKTSGEHLSRLTNDVTQIQSLAWDSFYGVISVGAQIVFSVIALGQMHWSLLLVSFVVSVVMLLVPGLASGRINAASENLANAQGLSMSKLKDLLG